MTGTAVPKITSLKIYKPSHGTQAGWRPECRGERGASVYATATATAASSRRRRTLHISGEQIGGGASRKQLGPSKYSSAVIVPRANVGTSARRAKKSRSFLFE